MIGRYLHHPERDRFTMPAIEHTPSHASETSPPRRRRVLAVVVALAIAAGVIAVVVRATTGADDDTTAAPTATTPTADATATPAELVDDEGLDRFAAALDTPVFWAGATEDGGYEVTRLEDGTVYVRYLPAGAEAGDPRQYLTIATYPRPAAFAEVQRASLEKGAETVPVGSGGIAVSRAAAPESVNFALPTVGAQVEVFSPRPGEARRLVQTGAVVPVGDSGAVVAPPFVATQAELRAFAAALPAPAYWAGPRSDKDYEVTRTSDGAVFVRYLPDGTAAGAPVDVLTVATYPGGGGVKALRAASRRDGVETLRIPGGIAVYDTATPTNVHVAFEDEDVQVEVYARTGVDVPALVERRAITAISKR